MMKSNFEIYKYESPTNCRYDIDHGFALGTELVLLSRLYNLDTHLGALWGRQQVAFVCTVYVIFFIVSTYPVTSASCLWLHRNVHTVFIKLSA